MSAERVIIGSGALSVERKAASLRRAQVVDKIMTGVMWLAAIFLIIVLMMVVGYLLITGVPALSWTFLTSSGTTAGGGGIGPQIFVTAYALILSLLITTPIGVGAAVYMAEYSQPNRFTTTIRFSIEALSSVPSIVFGLFGALLFVRLLGWGFSVLGGVLTMTILNLPIMVRVTEDALRTVPRSFREASFALASTKWETIRKVILPSALPGILTAVVLTAGRVVGETAPLILVMGTTISPNAEYSINPMNTGSTLAVHIWVLKIIGVPGLQNSNEVAAGTAAVLMFIILGSNALAAYFTDRERKRLSGAAKAPRAGGSKKD